MAWKPGGGPVLGNIRNRDPVCLCVLWPGISGEAEHSAVLRPVFSGGSRYAPLRGGSRTTGGRPGGNGRAGWCRGNGVFSGLHFSRG